MSGAHTGQRTQKGKAGIGKTRKTGALGLLQGGKKSQGVEGGASPSEKKQVPSITEKKPSMAGSEPNAA